MALVESDTLSDASFNALMAAGGLQARDEQRDFAFMVEQALADTGKIALLHADTGIGKSLGYLIPAFKHLATAPRRPRVIIATHSHILMNQLLEKDRTIINKVARAFDLPAPSVGRLLGRMNFISPERVDVAVQGQSLTHTEQLEIERLRSWTGTISEYEDEYGSLPLGLTEASICLTVDCESEEFDAQQRIESSCDIVVTTHAMIALDMLRKHRLLQLADQRPTLLIVDEADAMANQLGEWTQRRLNLVRVLHQLEPHLPSAHLVALSDAITHVRSLLVDKHYAWDTALAGVARNVLSLLTGLATLKRLDTEVAVTLQRAIQSVTSHTMGLGLSLERHEPAIVALNPWFARNFGEYATTYYEAVILTSGTLSITPNPSSGTAWIRTDLGITDAMLGACAIFSPSHYGNMTFNLAGPDFPPVFQKTDAMEEPELNGEWVHVVADRIANSHGRVVVLTASHKESLKLAKLLDGKVSCPTVIHQQGEPLKTVVSAFQRHCESGKGCIMITAAGHAGLNITSENGGVGFDRLVITRVTYGKPKIAEVEALASYYLNTQKRDLYTALHKQEFMRTLNAAIRQMRQALGRGIRSPQDNMVVDICDPRFPLSFDLSSKYAALRNIIPQRFMLAYQTANLMTSAGNTPDPELEEVFF